MILKLIELYFCLSGNELDQECMKVLAKWLQKCVPNMEELYLDDNELGNKGALALINAIKNMRSLRLLSCCTCEIGGKAGVNLIK